MILSELRKACRLEYLGVFTDTEDRRFTNDGLNHLINAAHQRLAEVCDLYRTTRDFNIAVGERGVSRVNLPPEVYMVVPDAVRLWDGTSETTLEYREETSQVQGGPFANVDNGTPSSYYLRAGAERGRSLVIALTPGASAAMTGGLRVGCWIFPAQLTDDASTNSPAFWDAEHQCLVTQVVAAMARIDRNLGRADAPVEETRRDAKEAEDRLRQLAQESRRPGGVRRVIYTGDW